MIKEMSLFDRIIPDSIKSNVKEVYYAYQYYSSRMFSEGTEPILQVEVETNSACNRTCNICPNKTNTRGNNHIDDTTYNSLLEQLSDINFSGVFTPCFYNEPLLDDKLEELMSSARKKLPTATIIVYTNGSLLSKNRLESLTEAGVDGFIVSQYEDNLEREDIREFLSTLPKELRHLVRYRILTADQKLSTRGGLVTVENSISKSRCYQASTATILDYKGNVLLCCNDYFSRYVFGNINDETLIKIWNKPYFKEIRKNLRKGNFDNEMCLSCAGEK